MNRFVHAAQPSLEATLNPRSAMYILALAALVAAAWAFGTPIPVVMMAIVVLAVWPSPEPAEPGAYSDRTVILVALLMAVIGGGLS